MPAFDGVGPSAAGFGNLASGSATWSHSNGGNAIYAAIALGVGADGPFTTTAKYGGVDMTSVSKIHTNNTTVGYLEVFTLSGGSLPGGTNNVVVTAVGGTPLSLAGGSISVANAGVAVAPQTAFGTGTNPTKTTAGSTNGSLLLGFTAVGNNIASATAPSTSRFIINEATSSGAGNCAGATSPGTGSNVTMAWSTTVDFWAEIIIEILPLVSSSGWAQQPGGQVYRSQYRRVQWSAAAPGDGTSTVSLGDSGSGDDSNFAVIAAVPLDNGGSGADSLALSASVPLADAGTGSDATTVAASAPLADGGSGSDALAILVTAALADTGSGSDQAGAAASVALPDSGSGADSFQMSRTVPLGDSGSGTDALSAAAAVGLGDAGSGTDTAAVTVALGLSDSGSASDTAAEAASVLLSDSGAASDQAAVVAVVAISDTGSGADQLQAAGAVTLPDSGGGTDVLGVGASVPLLDTGSGTDVLVTIKPGAPDLTDGGSGADFLTVTVAAALADQGTSTDVIGVTAAVPLADSGTSSEIFGATALITLAEAGSGTDVLSVLTGPHPVGLADGGSGNDTLTVIIMGAGQPLLIVPSATLLTQRWRAIMADGRWSGRLTSWNWRAGPLVAGWAAQMIPTSWQVSMADLDPVWSGSKQYVPVLVTAALAGTSPDPTADTVQMSFVTSSGNPRLPAPPVSWQAASWLPGTTTPGSVARCLIGPGGTITLSAGKYDVWVKITAPDETPAIFAGTLTVI